MYHETSVYIYLYLIIYFNIIRKLYKYVISFRFESNYFEKKYIYIYINRNVHRNVKYAMKIEIKLLKMSEIRCIPNMQNVL